VGDALELAADDDSVDAVVMLGPLYHLVDRSDRVAALREAHRVLQPGGVLVAEVMTRHSWLLDTALKEKWGAPEEWERLEASLTSGRSLGAEAEVPEKLLRAIRLSESDPSMLGVSAHVMGVANRH
jgi:SAM-dependent methyltransferase